MFIMKEQTLVIIKPDGVRRKIAGKIIKRFENRYLDILDLKMETLTKEQLEQHYQHLVEKPFYPEIVEYMTSGPVILMILSGEDAIATVRQIVGATNPLEAQVGTIRGEFGQSKSQNLVHASDSAEAAKLEIARFFG